MMIQIFASTKKIIQQIRLHSSGLSGNKESQLSYNVSSALVSSLQNLFNDFRNSQHNYLNSKLLISIITINVDYFIVINTYVFTF